MPDRAPKPTPPAAKPATAAKKAAPTKRPPAIGAGRAKGTAGGRPSKADLVRQIEDSLTKLAGALVLAGEVGGNPRLVYDGRVIELQAGDVARLVYSIAERNASVRRLLESLYQTSGRLESFTIAASVLVPIAVNHGWVPSAVLAIPGMAGETLRSVGAPPPRPKPTPKPPKPAPSPAAARPTDRPPAPTVDLSAPAPWRSTSTSSTPVWRGMRGPASISGRAPSPAPAEPAEPEVEQAPEPTEAEQLAALASVRAEL